MRRSINFRTIAPYALLLPGLLWLAVFYVYPAIQMFLVSLWTGNIQDGFEQTWNWGIYPQAITEYWPWIARSIVYGGLATILAFALGFPLAYAIAFRGGQYKNLLLFLVIAPFFTSFLLRTISWKIILADDGLLLGPLKAIGILPEEFRLLATPAAVIAGITYNFLPFMTLPLYVALEKIDRRLLEAAEDLYAGPWRPQGTIAGALVGGILGVVVGVVMEYGPLSLGIPGAIIGGLVGTYLISQAFVRVTLPLAVPGIFAGSLLTFIPAVGDYINAELLGNPAVADDRERHPGPLPEGHRLSDRVGAVVHPDARDPGRRADLHPPARHRGPDLMATSAAVAVRPPRDRREPRSARLVDRWLLPLYVLGVTAYLVLPVLIMIIFSFNDPAGRSNLTWRGFSLDAWLNPLGRPGLAEAVGNSLVIAFISTIVATILGTLIALALVRYQFRGRSATNLLIFLPMSTPGDRPRRVPADDVHRLGRAAVRARGRGLPAQHPDDHHRPHHVQHQLRGGHREGPDAGLPAASRGSGDGPRAPTSGRPSGRSPSR